MRDRSEHSTLLVDEGPIYTKGRGFRARAEARQRRFRSQVLRCECDRYGHVLCASAASAGLNFIHPAALAAAQERSARGKGLHVQKTFANMCSSQAMCFNLFGPLTDAPGLAIATDVLRRYIADLASVRKIQFEYVPPPEVFRDQNDGAPVSTDLLIEFQTNAGAPALLSVEMKFVEPEFMACAFRSPLREEPCRLDLAIDDAQSGCRYVSHKGYAYWERSSRLGTVRPDAMRNGPCPFGGPLWQLWVNHTMVHAVAAQQHISRVMHAVCAPLHNEKLMARDRIESFAALLRDPGGIALIPLEDLVDDLVSAIPDSAPWRDWANQARARYVIE